MPRQAVVSGKEEIGGKTIVWARDADLPLQGPRSHAQRWVLLADSARITRYGASYTPGMLTASGEPYSLKAIAALGPGLLREARAVTGEQWGMRIRVTDLSSGRSATFRVVDMGLAGLEVDLPDPQWLAFGHPVETGLFYGRLEVLR